MQRQLDAVTNDGNRATKSLSTAGKQNLKKINFFPWPEYMTSHGVGTNEAVQAKDSNVPEFRLMLGSKPIPENFVYGSKEALGLLKESLGIASARDGTATGGLTYDFSKFIGGINFERAVGGLRGQGVSTRNGGAPIILQLRNFGMPGAEPVGFADAQKMKGVLAIVVFSLDLILRTGSCEVRE